MLRTITVKKLIEALQNEDPEARVVFCANYGDRAQTLQALPLRGNVESVTLQTSAYSDSGYAIVEDDEEDDGNEDGTFVVIR